MVSPHPRFSWMKPRFLFEAHIRMEESPRRPRLLVENDGVRGRADAAGTGGGVERSWAWADAAALRGWGLRAGRCVLRPFVFPPFPRARSATRGRGRERAGWAGSDLNPRTQKRHRRTSPDLQRWITISRTGPLPTSPSLRCAPGERSGGVCSCVQPG